VFNQEGKAYAEADAASQQLLRKQRLLEPTGGVGSSVRDEQAKLS